MKRSSPLFIAFITVAIDLLGFGIVLPLIPLYADRFLAGASALEEGLWIGLLMSSFSAMQFLFAPGCGRLSDRIGRRPVLIVGLLGSVIFYSLFGVATYLESLPLLFLARIGAGIAGATIGTAQAVIADSTPPEKRARGMALIGVAFGIGFTLGPLVGSLFAVDDPKLPMSVAPGFAAASLSFIALILAIVLLPETRPVTPPQPRPWFNVDGWKLALGTRGIALPLWTFFIATLAFATFEGTVARYAKDHLQLNTTEIGRLFAYFGLVLMLTQGLIVRRIVTRLGEVVMCLIGSLLMLTGLLAVALFLDPNELSTVLVVTALAVMGFAFLTPSAQALISRRSSVFRQGEVLGVNQAASAIARILGPLMGNMLYGGSTNPHVTWPFYASAGFLGIAFLLAVRMKMDGEPAEPSTNALPVETLP